jgi:NitT/TauT family transport system substrate-binding protein
MIAVMNVAIRTLAFAILAVTVGCSKSDNTAAAPTAQAAPIAEVRLGFFPNLTHAQAVLGVTSGEFASAVAPAKFTNRQFPAGPSLIEALFANQIDIGYVGPGPVISAWARSHGQGIRVVSGAAANGVVIVARKDSGINALSDLVGKKVATPQNGNTQDIAARHYLKSTLQQADLKNVLPIPNADQAGMMSRGDIDASWAPEPWGSILVASTGGKIIGEEKDLWPHKEFSLTVVVTTPEFLAAHPDVVEKVLAVHRSWTARLNAEPTRYVPQLEQALASLTGKKLPPGIVEDALKRVKFDDEVVPETFESNAQWAYDLGFAKEKPNLDGLTNLTILKKLSASAPATPATNPAQ